MFPSGQTRASRLKALLSCLEAEQGVAAADAWLASLRLARTDFEDETRLLPLVAFHSALVSLAKKRPGTLERSGPYLAAHDNLGVWARVLRVARSPEEAFERIESSESEYGRTTRWERIEGRPGYWRGRVRIGHDPRLEKDGLLADARGVELAIIPTLFGYPPASVTLCDRKDDVQEFEARWPVPVPGRLAAAGAGSGVAVGVAAAVAYPSAWTVGAAVLAPFVLGVLGRVRHLDRVRRIESAAQAMRVSALERSLALRESEHSNAAGDLEGTVVAGQYRIGSRMGSGASGVIYQATRIADGLPVAIKLLRAAAVHDVTASDRLRRESEALGLSWHPNVVESIDHGHLPDGTSYLIMELLHGETLAARLLYRRRLTAPEVLPIAKQVSEALVAIHAAGVVHRDLKPSNIYLVPDAAVDGADRVKVFDFGIARVEWEEMRITNIGAPLGTPGYMSPEQEVGEEIDARSDVYAAGAVIYECLVGQPPPASRDDMWKPLIRRSSVHLREAYDLETEKNGADSGVHRASRPAVRVTEAGSIDVPAEWRVLVERALAKRPDDRFQDARALLGAIRRIEGRDSKVPEESTGSGRL